MRDRHRKSLYFSLFVAMTKEKGNCTVFVCSECAHVWPFDCDDDSFLDTSCSIILIAYHIDAPPDNQRENNEKIQRKTTPQNRKQAPSHHNVRRSAS